MQLIRYLNLITKKAIKDRKLVELNKDLDIHAHYPEKTFPVRGV